MAMPREAVEELQATLVTENQARTTEGVSEWILNCTIAQIRPFNAIYGVYCVRQILEIDRKSANINN